MTPLGSRDVAAAWNAAVPPRYRIDTPLVQRNLLGHSLLHPEASGWFENGFVAIKRSAASLYDGPDPKVAHLSLFNDASETALDRAIETLKAEGIASLVVGQDSGHFLPGAPTDVPWMGRFLRQKGFVAGGLSFDLERDLSENTPASGAADGFRPLTEADLPALDAFLLTTFPGRWHFDTFQKVEADGAGTVFGLFRDGSCQGFAVIQTEGCRLPIGGAVWQGDLGQGWAALGPIGIAESIRKEGLGARLLHEALDELRRRGARRTIIDWTGLLDFYGAEGFAVARAYRSYQLDLI